MAERPRRPTSDPRPLQRDEKSPQPTTSTSPGPPRGPPPSLAANSPNNKRLPPSSPPPADAIRDLKQQKREDLPQPRREERVAAPYRPPPGVPPGKDPPLSPPPRQEPPSGRPPPEKDSAALSVQRRRPAPPPSDDAARVKPVRPLPADPPPKQSVPPPPTDPPPSTENSEVVVVPPPPTDPPPAQGGVPAPPSTFKQLTANSSGPGGGNPPQPEAENAPAMVPPGRLRVKCIEGLNIHRKDKSTEHTKIDAYLRLTLGSDAKHALRKETEVKKRSGSHIFFDDEIVEFDIVHPKQFLKNGDIDLLVQLRDEQLKNDGDLVVIATADTSVLQLMVDETTAGVGVVETLQLRVVGEKTKSTSSSGLKVEFVFEPAKVGMAVFTLFEGRNLKNMDTVGRQDPYVKFSLRDVVKQSQTQKDGGSDPSFGEEQIALWVDEGAWTEDVVVQVYDEDEGTDDLIGACSFSLLPYMSGSKKAEGEVYELFAQDNKRHGDLLMKLDFLPAGLLNIRCLSANNLFSAGTATRHDPYVVFTTEGQCSTRSKRTHVDQDGGREPEWNETIVLEIVDHYELRIECYDHDVVTQDQLIGEIVVSLLPVFKKGFVDDWFTMTRQHSSSGQSRREAGDIHLVLEFEGPDGVKYPQHRPGIDAFDERDRVNKIQEELKRLDEEEVQLADKVMDKTARTTTKRAPNVGEFKDSEIEAAFKFIDLDHNNYVGAAEIRHVLICMGELITDEEVDEMIKMVDADGDGQISYREFYAVVTHPDPGHADDLLQQHHVEGKEDGASLVQGDNRTKAKAHDRQKELEIRERKRKMLGQFVQENGIGKDEVTLCFQRYVAEKRQGRPVDFETYCKLLGIEETGESHLLFNLFDRNDEKAIDMKEFILGMCNWVAELTKEERTSMVFDLYDDDRSGFLSMSELKGILMGNHMQSEAAVQKKLETIIKQADQDGDGTLSRAEFDIVGKKFPTILFPKAPTTTTTT